MHWLPSGFLLPRVSSVLPVSFLLSISLALLASPLCRVSAQSFETHQLFWEITPQAGFFAPEEPEGAEIEARELLGGRVGFRRAAGFGFEVHGAYAPLEFEADGNPAEVFDLTTFLYGVDGLYAWAINPRSDFFVGVGFGGITWTPDRELVEDEPETNLRASLGAGVHYLIASQVALRGDLRDHIIFDQLADVSRSLALVDRGQTNNLEGSLGVSIVLP